MDKTIHVELSTKSIENAIRELTIFKLQFNKKMVDFVAELAERGILVAEACIADSEGTTDKSHQSYVSWESMSNNVVRASLIIKGNGILFIEFGAGIHYNATSVGNSPHPKGEEMGYVIGSYSDSVGNGWSLGQYDSWTHDGQTSYGQQATMPMYNAEQEMIRSFLDVAEKVFG